ncbi:methyltransferase [Nannocystis sp. SCPEA4]|uniref:methyltransferase n=1 Tax=Nannocystis sp. SCPEA4 TaxID=2996787 RepID=UPI00226F5AB1|nr:methyltransferase [Nannocystis sp. SCPEA4]MCY1058895.1 methyltransferase [Nannocystis sp. SCPEA4]
MTRARRPAKRHRAAAGDDDLYLTVGAYVVPQLLYVAARLGLAELLLAGPRSAEDLAEQTGAHAPTLARVLRALASVGVFARTRDDRWRLTAAAHPLLRDHPRSRRAAVLFAGHEQLRAWGEVMHAVSTGLPAFDRAFGESLHQHLARDEAAMADAEALRARRAARRDQAVADALDLAGARTIVDVGGGGGELLIELLSRRPGARGLLVEAPHVAARTRARLAALGWGERCEVVVADAREQLPAGHDVYLLAEVVHCYDDADAARILRNCRGRQVIVVERVLPPVARASADRLADLHMLVMYGGRERTRREYADLLDAADLRLRRVVPTGSWVSILEAAPRVAR